MDGPTTPNGSSYNLRHRHKERERRCLSSSFGGNISVSDVSTPEHEGQHFDEHRQEHRAHSRSRTNSVSRAMPHVPKSIKGRPGIKRQPSSQFPPHERSIAGNVPPAFSTNTDTARWIDGSDNDSNNNGVNNAFCAPQPQEVISVDTIAKNPVTDNSACLGNDRHLNDRDLLTRNNDETSFGAIDGSSAGDVDVGFLKTAENSTVDQTCASLIVNAPNSVGLLSALNDLASEVGNASQSAEISSSISTTPSSRGSAQFLTASSFYGSASRHRSGSGASVSPRMGTKVKSRSPVKGPGGMTPLPPPPPTVNMTTCALGPRPGGTAASSTNIVKPKPTSYDHNANPVAVTANLFGMDGSPSSLRNRRPTGDFSDEEEEVPIAEPNNSARHVRFIGGGDGPDMPAKIVPEKTEWNLSHACIILMIAFGFLLLVGSYKKSFGDEMHDVQVTSQPVEETPSLSSPTQVNDVSPQPTEVEETSAEIYGRLKAELQSSIDETVQSSLGRLNSEWRRSVDSYGEKVGAVQSEVVALTERLVHLETAVDQLKAIQNKYGADLRALGMELKGINAGRVDTEARLDHVDDGVARLNELVVQMANHSAEIESSVKAAIVRLVTEVESVKTAVYSSSKSPPVNATELAASVRQLVGDMRETIADDLGRKIATEEDQLESRLKTELRRLLAVEIEALRPTVEEKEKEEEVAKMEKTISVPETTKEALVDYALESQGGSVIDEESSNTYITTGSTLSLFGVPVW